MKVLLLKDVYKLGNAGDVKQVAAGYGRNYLLPQGLAVLATSQAVEQADSLREAALAERAKLNTELSATAEVLGKLTLAYPVRASEQGRLYGSVTHQMLAENILAETGITIDRRTIIHSPIRQIGAYQVPIRLTADLIPEVQVLVHHEGTAPDSVLVVEDDEDEADVVPVAAPAEATATPDDETELSAEAEVEA